MTKKIFVFTNANEEIIASFTPNDDQNTHPDQPRIATHIPIRGQTIHEMEVPGHLPENVSTSILHQELAKILASRK